MIKDVLNSIKAHLYERASSPLLGAFVISWGIWNYRFLLVLSSSLSIEEKFSYIDTKIFCDTYTFLLYGGIYPVLTALLFIFAYPYPAKWVYEYSRNRQRELKEIRQKIDDETPLTKEESRNIKREALNIEISLQAELDRRNKENQRLKEEIESFSPASTQQTEMDNEDSLHTNQKISPNDEQMELLRLIAKSGDWVPEQNILSNSSLTRVKAEFNLGELTKSDYLKKSYRSGVRAMCFTLTHNGRTALVETGEYDKNA